MELVTRGQSQPIESPYCAAHAQCDIHRSWRQTGSVMRWCSRGQASRPPNRSASLSTWSRQERSLRTGPGSTKFTFPNILTIFLIRCRVRFSRCPSDCHIKISISLSTTVTHSTVCSWAVSVRQNGAQQTMWLRGDEATGGLFDCRYREKQKDWGPPFHLSLLYRSRQKERKLDRSFYAADVVRYIQLFRL